MSEPSPFVRLAVGNNVKKSIPKPKTTDPKWEENFQFLILDPYQQDLEVEVGGWRMESKNTDLTFSYDKNCMLLYMYT